MPSAEVQFQTKWWVLNTPEDFFQALKEIRADMKWNGGVDVWSAPDDPENPENSGKDVWQLHLSSPAQGIDPKIANFGNVVMAVAGSVQIFLSEAEWREAYPGLAGA